MSLISTLAPVILAAGFVLTMLIVMGVWVFRFVEDARAKAMVAKRDLRLERKAFKFVEDLFIETSSSDDLSQALPNALHETMWDIHNQLDQNKELTR